MREDHPTKGIIFFSLAILVLALCMWSGTAGLRMEKPEEKKESEKSREKIVIGCTLASEQSNYQEELGNLMSQISEKDDSYVLDVQYAQWNVATQEEQMHRFIREDVDAIIICPVNAKSFLNVLKEARAAEIPVINLNMKVDMASSEYVTAYVGASMSEEAEMAAALAIDYFDGKKGKIAIIEGLPGSDPQIYRTQAFLETLKSQPNLEVVGIANGEWKKEKAAEAARELLQKTPDIDMIYCHDNYMSQGVYQVLEDMGLKEQVKVIGISGAADHLKAIRDGLLYGLVTQPPEYEAAYALECAKKAAMGEKLRFWYKNMVEVVTIRNVEEYLEP